MSATPTVPLPDDLIGLAEAAALLPSRKPGRRLHTSVLYRWIREGKLLGWRVGGHWFVSRKDVLAVPQLAPEAPPRLVTSKQREREISEAKDVLRRAGFRT